MQFAFMDRMSSNEASSSCLPQESIHPACMISFTSCSKIGLKSNLPSVLTGMDLRQGFCCLHLLQWHLRSKLMQIVLSRTPSNTHYKIRRDFTQSESTRKRGYLGLVSGTCLLDEAQQPWVPQVNPEKATAK